MAPLVGPSWRPGRRYCRKRFGQPLKLPASLVTIASSGSRSRSHPMIAPRSSGPPDGDGTSPALYSARAASRQRDQRPAATGASAAGGGGGELGHAGLDRETWTEHAAELLGGAVHVD